MPNIGDRIKLKDKVAGSKDYVGYVYAQNPDNQNLYLIKFPGCTFGHNGIDGYGHIHGEVDSREYWWLTINEFEVTEKAKPITYADLMIE